MRGSFIFLDNNKKNKKKTIRVWPYPRRGKNIHAWGLFICFIY
jgi:hypothetical protein